MCRSSRSIATAPAAGPSASSATATGQPACSATSGVAWIVTTVSRNPIAVWVVSAVPV